VAIDAKRVSPGRWEIFTHGGRRATGVDAVRYAREVTTLGAVARLIVASKNTVTKLLIDFPALLYLFAPQP
jgi:cyclase